MIKLIFYAEFITQNNKIILREKEDKTWLIEIYIISHSVQDIEKKINVQTYETAYLFVYENYIKKEVAS